MKLNFHKSLWEVECANVSDLNHHLAVIQNEGYQGTELFLPFYNIDLDATLEAHASRGLDIITGIATDGKDLQAHVASLVKQVEYASLFSPKLINCHTGRDIFSLEDNLTLFKTALELEQQYGITITHETHRFRPTFSTFGTEQIIDALPELKLNLDISHWMVVHESDLTDQQERLDKLFKSVHHIHGRVGYEEGPQVTDPQQACWQEHLINHTQCWQKVIDNALARKQEAFTITPEFGPFPYAHRDPTTGDNLTNIWKANRFMKQHLSEKLIIPT
ncbi:sugar phosphate isomerase/epimerase family protein [Psychromonas aquatilis]|uniref:TIM barrel protein n=1 Tax=Psychromonas aquatilis TaxID=2005072 RepID=A0ABU9GRK8_9GAMM